MDYSSIAIWLAVLTLLLIVAEIFVPSGGLISVFVVICAVVSIWAAWKAWYHPHPALWWVFLVCFVSAIPSVVALNLLILQRTSWGKRLMPEPVPADKSRPFSREREKLQRLVGSFGTTATLHTPGGITVVDGRRYHSESESFLIEPDTVVKVVRVEGTRIVIRAATETEMEDMYEAEQKQEADHSPEVPQTDVSQTDRSSEPKEKLDFPFPEG